MEKRYVIGIDPGQHTGIAFYDKEKKEIILAECEGFHRAYELLNQHPPCEVHAVVIEVPRTKTVWHTGATRRGAQDRTAVNVGSVLREAELLCERALACGHNLVRVHPTGKLSKETVFRLTGYNGKRNNEHIRDAVMLAWGR